MRNFQVVNLGRIIFEHGISCTENFGWWDSWRVVGLWSSLGWNVSWRTSLVWVRLHSFCDSWQALFCAATTCFARFVDCLHNYVVSSVGRQTFWAESEDRRICFKLGKSFSSECPPKSAQIFNALYRDLLFLPWNFLKQHIFACTRKHPVLPDMANDFSGNGRAPLPTNRCRMAKPFLDNLGGNPLTNFNLLRNTVSKFR